MRFLSMGIVAVLALSVVANAKVSFESLLEEMTDLESLTYFPEPAYSVKQFSSYDRNAKDPAVLTDENWFANGDRGQHLRVEQRNGAEEWVLMDAAGPGAIVRFWSANPADAGIVRVYLDNAETPAVEMPLTDMLGGARAPFVKPIAGERSRGWNSYLPIPYAKHCKVTTSKRDFYYQINYRTYEPETRVQTFSMQLDADTLEDIDEVAQRLAQPRISSDGNTTADADFDLAPGESSAATIESGRPAAIRELLVTVRSENVPGALRGTLLEIAFDGQAPTVVAPLGDFFATAPGINAYQSLPSGVAEGQTLYAQWVMPFKKTCEIRLLNLGDASVAGTVRANSDKYDWKDNSMYFHAGFRSEYPISTRPRQDWTFLNVNGKGRFVGDMLHITNSVKDWWGEGDEKIYIDGETFPSHFGTGTEDYFGYAWCCPEVFTHAYHNQPRCDGPGNYGHTCVSRFHVIDNIPFNTSFKFDMEVWHWKECKIAMAATSYWYAFPGATHGFAPLTASSLRVVDPQPLPPPRKVEGALEGELLAIIEKTGGIADPQGLSDQWSGESHLWWRDAKPGDKLVLAVPVENPGTYDVRAAFTKAVDYGIHTISINGKEAVAKLDLYNDGVIAVPETSLGVHALDRGQNTLTVTVIGSNPKAVQKFMFGLDYIKLVPGKREE